MKKTVRIVAIAVLLLQSFNLFSQEENGITVGADLVNRYLWRGIENGLGFDGSHSAQIQPSVVGTYKNFEVGYWGSYGLSNGYSEYDVWAKFTIRQFSISVYDYNQQFEDKDGGRHGSFYNIPFHDAGSFAELTFAYEGGDKFPLYASYNRFIYNDDATYIEAGYLFNTHKLFPMDFTVGMTPAPNSYGNHAGIINLALKVSYDLKFSEKFKIPLFASLVDNPQAEKTFFVFGVSLSTN